MVCHFRETCPRHLLSGSGNPGLMPCMCMACPPPFRPPPPFSPASVILSEAPALSFEGKNLLSGCPGMTPEAWGRGLRAGISSPHPGPSPSRGRGRKKGIGEEEGFSAMVNSLSVILAPRGNPGASIRLPGGVRRSFPRMWESTGRRAASHAATTVPRARESMDVWIVACGLSFPANTCPRHLLSGEPGLMPCMCMACPPSFRLPPPFFPPLSF